MSKSPEDKKFNSYGHTTNPYISYIKPEPNQKNIIVYRPAGHVGVAGIFVDNFHQNEVSNHHQNEIYNNYPVKIAGEHKYNNEYFFDYFNSFSN